MKTKKKYIVSVTDVTVWPDRVDKRFVREEATYAVSPAQAKANVMHRNGWTKSNMYCAYNYGDGYRETVLEAREAV